MRTFLTAVLSIFIGAVAFHGFYLHEPPSGRCTWDHLKAAGNICRAAAGP